MDISIGTVTYLKGEQEKELPKLKEKTIDCNLKKSVITIENPDNICMVRAIGVSWAKLMRCTPKEWAEITKSRGNKSNMQLSLEHPKVSKTYYNVLTSKKLKQQGQLAEALCQLAGVSTDRPVSLNDIEAFEEVLGGRVMVVSARLGNMFITSPSNDERPCFYLYLVRG